MFFEGSRFSLLTAGMMAVAFSALVLFSGCSDEPEVDPMEEQLSVEPEELAVPEGEPYPPEEIDIEDPERASDTVLATVDGHEILLQDIYDEFAGIPVHQQAEIERQQHLLLDHIIQQRLILQKAREKEVGESELFEEIMEDFKASPMAADMDEETIVNAALMETLLQQEVVEKVDISEEEIREVFEQYRQMMPEDVEFEQMKPYLEQMMLREHVDQYLQNLYEEADIDMDEDWLREKEEEATDARPPMMPEGDARPVQ